MATWGASSTSGSTSISPLVEGWMKRGVLLTEVKLSCRTLAAFGLVTLVDEPKVWR
jgi:hypothetical protein